MAFVLLENSSSSIEGVFFPEVYEKAKPLLLREGEVFHIKGSPKSNRGGSGRQIVVEDIVPVDEFLQKAVQMEINLERSEDKDPLADLKTLLDKSSAGRTEILLKTFFKDSAGQKAFVEIIPRGGFRRICPSYDFLQKSADCLKAEGVSACLPENPLLCNGFFTGGRVPANTYQKSCPSFIPSLLYG